MLGWHSYELASIPAGFVLQLLADGVPPLRQDRPVEATLLRHVLSWPFHRALGGARHVADCRVLNRDERVVSDDLSRDEVFCDLQRLDALTLYSAERDKTCRYFLDGLPFQRNRRLALPPCRLTFTQRARPSRNAESLQRCVFRRSLRRIFRCWLASMPAICRYWCWSLTTVSLCTTPGSILQDWYGAGDRGWLGNSYTSVAVNVLPCRVMLMDY